MSRRVEDMPASELLMTNEGRANREPRRVVGARITLTYDNGEQEELIDQRTSIYDVSCETNFGVRQIRGMVSNDGTFTSTIKIAGRFPVTREGRG